MKKKEIIEVCKIRRGKVKGECAWRMMIATANCKKWEAWNELSGSRLDKDFFSRKHNYIVELTASGLMETNSIHDLKRELTILMIKLLNVMSSKPLNCWFLRAGSIFQRKITLFISSFLFTLAYISYIHCQRQWSDPVWRFCVLAAWSCSPKVSNPRAAGTPQLAARMGMTTPAVGGKQKYGNCF